jgi:hypothetical protein
MNHWCQAFEAAYEDRISFVLLDGKPQSIEAGAGEKMVEVFGNALLAISLDAIATGTFKPLTLSDQCELDIEEFDGMWAWPAKYEDCGKTNLIRKLKTTRLPD